jgi:hypothetical protein
MSEEESATYSPALHLAPARIESGVLRRSACTRMCVRGEGGELVGEMSHERSCLAKYSEWPAEEDAAHLRPVSSAVSSDAVAEVLHATNLETSDGGTPAFRKGRR